jgi:hypothetical protein
MGNMCKKRVSGPSLAAGGESLLFRDSFWKRATAHYPGDFRHSIRFCGLLSVAFAMI